MPRTNEPEIDAPEQFRRARALQVATALHSSADSCRRKIVAPYLLLLDALQDLRSDEGREAIDLVTDALAKVIDDVGG